MQQFSNQQVIEGAVSLLGGQEAARRAFAEQWTTKTRKFDFEAKKALAERGLQFWSSMNAGEYATKLADLGFWEGLDEAEASQIRLELDEIVKRDDAEFEKYQFDKEYLGEVA